MTVNWNSPVLKSLEPVVSQPKLVHINKAKLVDVANWMAYEEFPKPDGSMLFDFGNKTVESCVVAKESENNTSFPVVEKNPIAVPSLDVAPSTSKITIIPIVKGKCLF